MKKREKEPAPCLRDVFFLSFFWLFPVLLVVFLPPSQTIPNRVQTRKATKEGHFIHLNINQGGLDPDVNRAKKGKE
jgi:hypothetical protein